MAKTNILVSLYCVYLFLFGNTISVLNIIKNKLSETTTTDIYIYINRESSYYVYFINSYVLVKQMYNNVYIKSAVHCLD